MLLNAFLQAIREIRRNLMRSLLTAIGIVIGIASVIAMVNIGQGASESITASVGSLGSNTLHIMPGQEKGPPGMSGTSIPFEMKDVRILQKSIFTLEAVSPMASSTVNVLYRDRSYQTSVRGVENGYFDVQNWNLAEGERFSESELRAGQSVCILGQTVIDELFPGGEDPMGKKIRLKSFSCRVIGTLEEKGANTFGMDQDDLILVPIKMFQRRIGGNQNIPSILVSVKENYPLDTVKQQIRQVLRESRNIKPGKEDNFAVRSMTALLDTLSQITSMLTVMLGAVAAISLVVGGIGIMNIMLVSVTERTREIGIRMAIGAMSQDILIQFLIEAVVLSGLGGIFGVLTGIGITVGVAEAMDLTLVINPAVTTVALLFSMLIGIVFGIIPARKAANMNPIDALRYE
ncbi:ABC transporter permease [Sulfurimonas sp. HSL1-2]|uniref:ABC transporter permease n=1 Tax=Thiomicrolovo zhangzhouensis TaxID=3131933 RepID=UPI0031F775CA